MTFVGSVTPYVSTRSLGMFMSPVSSERIDAKL
jgi:hypothetical protein